MQGGDETTPVGWQGVRELEPETLVARLAAGDPLVVIDVREPWEWNTARLPAARHIPLASFARDAASLDPSHEIVLYCHHGMRSLAAANYLAAQGFTRLWNLSGGIDRFAIEGDPSIPRY
jgi:rhodanese-related sulfurtransferase